MKTFQPITTVTVVNKDNKSFQFYNVPYIGLLWYLYRLRRDIVERKIFDQLKSKEIHSHLKFW